jgi:hypothetical protein
MTTWAHRAAPASTGRPRPTAVRMMRVGRSPGVISGLPVTPARDPRARTYSSHQQAAVAPTASHAAWSPPATMARAAGMAASASRSRAESRRKPTLVVRPDWTATAPSRESSRPDRVTARQAAAGPTHPSTAARGTAAAAHTRAATVTTFGETPARASGRATAAAALSHPPTKPPGGSVRCRAAQSRTCSSPSMCRKYTS